MAQFDPSIIFPGWYWYDYELKREAEVLAYLAANRGSMIVRRRWEGDSVHAMVFEVRQNIRWTIYGLPTKAPKGARTELSDMVSGPPPSPSFTTLVEEMGEKVKEGAKSTSTALNVLVWGAVAVVLFNLYSATKSEGGSDGD